MTARRAAVVLAAVLTAPAGAQTVDEIVSKYVAARGGAAKLAAVQSVRMTAKARAPGGREAVVVREVKRPGRIRVEFTSQGVTGVYACDGEQGWQVSPLEGQWEPRAMPPEEVRVALEQSDIGGPLVGWKAKGHKVELMGRESLDGRPVFKLAVTLKSGDVREMYIDVESSLHVRTESTRPLRGRQIAMETSFGDYRPTDGVLFPHSVEVGAKGRPDRLRIVVDKVEVNPVLDDVRFRMPR
jgi:hypothetical protein